MGHVAKGEPVMGVNDLASRLAVSLAVLPSGIGPYFLLLVITGCAG